jgi:endogenous inhibitor of DNA gyrase (YacG/DUF329 family)
MKHHCPICRKPTDSVTDAEFPFCSERCRLVDLGNWATEKYKVSEPMMDESEVEESETIQPGSQNNSQNNDGHDDE